MFSTQPPVGLAAPAKKIWKGVVSELIDAGTFDKVSASAVARYCEVVVLYQRVMGVLMEADGTQKLIEVVMNFKGEEVGQDISAETKLVELWLREMHKFWKSFGFLDGATAKDRIGQNRDGEEVTEEKTQLRGRLARSALRIAGRREHAG